MHWSCKKFGLFVNQNLSEGAGRALLLWLGLSAAGHFFIGEPALINFADATETLETQSPATELPSCSSEDVRSQFEQKLNAMSTQTLKVQIAAVPKSVDTADSRLCVATVSGPLAQGELLFLVQWIRLIQGNGWQSSYASD